MGAREFTEKPSHSRFNSGNALKAILGHWGEVRNADALLGIGNTAPKAINFSQNIIGSKHAATIDVWAARLLQRLAGGKRIPSRAETSVSGALLEDGTTTLQFGLGQDVFKLAAEKVAKDPRFWDPAEGGHEKLKGMNPDDLQAVVWFLEKERWDRGGWTTAAGAGGSFELEYAILGYPDRAKLADARSILNRKKIRAAIKSKDFSGLTDEERQEYAWANGVWQDALTYRPARYVLGLSGEMGETQGVKDKSGVPTDEQQSGFLARLRKAARLGDPKDNVPGEQQLLSMRFNSTLGVYGSSGERSIDGELTTRLGFSPRELWKTMCRIGIERRQDAIFLSRVIRKGEEINYKRHRPGIEIYFEELGEYIEEQLKPGYTGEKNHITRLLDILRERGITQYTLVTEPLSPLDASNGKMPRVLGIRAQSVPEFDERWGEWGENSPILKKDGSAPANWRGTPKEERKKWSELSDEEIERANKRLGKDWQKIAERINDEVRSGGLKGITFSKQFWYDTRVAFRNEYEGIVNGEAPLLQGSARGAVSGFPGGRGGSELEPDAAIETGDTGRGERGAQADGSGIPEVAVPHGRAEHQRRVAPVPDSPGRDIREGVIAARDWVVEAKTSKLLTEDVHRPVEAGGELHQRGASRADVKGSYLPDIGQMKFTRFADLSTFAHEHAHHYLNCLMKFGINSRYDYIRDDIRTLLDLWHIGDGSMTLEQRLKTWDGLGVEGQRKFHEQFASHFEIYLSEGKAPAKGLAGVFQRIGEWLRALYHNAAAKEVGERYRSEIGEDLPGLSDEVRTVLGHMFQAQDEAAAARPAIRVPQSAVAAARVLQTEEATDQKAAAPLAGPEDPLSVAAGRQALMKAADDINSGRPVDVSRELDDVPMNEKALTAFRKQLDRKVIEWKSEFRYTPKPGLLGNMVAPVDENVARSVAGNPDPEALGFSRTGTVADGAPMVVFGSIPEKIQGTASFIWVDGRKVPVVYAVVEAGSGWQECGLSTVVQCTVTKVFRLVDAAVNRVHMDGVRQQGWRNSRLY